MNRRAPARWEAASRETQSCTNTVFSNCEGYFLMQKLPTAQNFSFGHIGVDAVVFTFRCRTLRKKAATSNSWTRA